MIQVVLCTLVLSLVCVHGATINSISMEGFEVLELDYPSFITDFRYDWVTDKFYAYADSVFRQINHDSKTGFQAIDNTSLVPYDQPFIDVRLFTDKNGKFWAVGPTYNVATKPTSAVGYFFPLTVIGPEINEDFQGDYRGFTFYAVSADTRNISNVLAYFVGWGPGDGTSVDFVCVRARFSLTSFRGLSWDAQKDVVYLHTNTYHPYTGVSKPRIIHDYSNNEIFVISPSFLRIYRISAPADGTSPLQLYDSIPVNQWGPLTGTTFHWYNDLVYLSFKATTSFPATLIEVNLKSFVPTRKMYFPTNFTNPRCMTGRNSTLYVGFEGGPSIVSVDTSKKDLEISGYAKTPGWLHTVYTAWDEGTDHVYFATHEEKSKVFRTSKKNFCKSDCPTRGYCEDQLCKCPTGYALSKDKKECALHLEEKKVISDRGAAVAFGILWALTCVVAAAGWYIVYRARQQGYQRVL